MTTRFRRYYHVLLCFAVWGMLFLGSGPKVAVVRAAEIFPLTKCPEWVGDSAADGLFAGTCQGRLFVAGGTDGVRFSDTVTIFEKDARGDVQTRISDVKLPVPMADGASASVAGGIILMGGRTVDGPTAAVWFVTCSAQGTVSMESLPPLPIPLVRCAAVPFENGVCVAGGWTIDASGKRIDSDACWTLDLSKKGSNGWGWTALPPLPKSRYDAALAVQNRRDPWKGIFLFGGKTIGADGTESELTDAWTYARETGIWEPVEVTIPPHSSKTADEFTDNRPGGEGVSFSPTAISSGTTHVLFFKNRTDADESFLDIDAYNVITGRFFPLDSVATAIKRNPVPVRWGNDYCLVGGDPENTVWGVEVQKRQNRLGVTNIVVITVYFLILAWMGYYFSKRQKGTEDYFRGGSRVPWWAVGVSLFGASLSAISYMAAPAKAFMTNWDLFFLSSAYLWAAPLLTAFFIPRLRRYNLTSAYEYLEKRFNVVVRSLGSGIFISFQVVRMAIMLFLPAIAINVVTNFDIFACIILVGAVSVVYTMFGGIEAVIWTDVIQVFILMGGIVLALIIVSFQLDDGFLDVLRVGWEDHKYRCADWRFVWNEPSIWVVLIASFFICIVPLTSDQTMVQRYFVGKKDTDASRGLWTFAWITLPGSALLLLLGTAFYVFYKAHPAECSVLLDNNDSLLPWFIITQMPPGVSGLLIVAILAASMSSLSASMNSIAAAWTVDFHQRLFRFPESSALWTAKASTLVSGALAIILAVAMVTWDIGSFWDEYNRLLGLVTSSLAGIFFLGLLSKRANACGAVAGLVLSFVFQLYVVDHQLVHLLLYSGTGFVSALVFGYVASFLFTRPTCRKIEEGDS